MNIEVLYFILTNKKFQNPITQNKISYTTYIFQISEMSYLTLNTLNVAACAKTATCI